MSVNGYLSGAMSMCLLKVMPCHNHSWQKASLYNSDTHLSAADRAFCEIQSISQGCTFVLAWGHAILTDIERLLSTCTLKFKCDLYLTCRKTDVVVGSFLSSCTFFFFFSWHHNVTCANDSHYHLKEVLNYANHVAEHIFVTCFSLSYFGVVWAVFTDIHLLQKEKPPAWNSISLFKCFCLTSALWIPNAFECWCFL